MDKKSNRISALIVGVADKNVHNLSFKDVQIEFKEHQPTASNIYLCRLKRKLYRYFKSQVPKIHKIR